MTRTVTKVLVATVIEVADLNEVFPASVRKGRIGLDIRIEQGSLSMGEKVRLSGPDSEEEVEIVGIEMLRNSYDPNVVRVHCSKPNALMIPNGRVNGWSIVSR